MLFTWWGHVIDQPCCYFVAIWKVVKQWMTEEQRRRTIFCKFKELKEYISQDQLPQYMGGTVGFVSLALKHRVKGGKLLIVCFVWIFASFPVCLSFYISSVSCYPIGRNMLHLSLCDIVQGTPVLRSPVFLHQQSAHCDEGQCRLLLSHKRNIPGGHSSKNSLMKCVV